MPVNNAAKSTAYTAPAITVTGIAPAAYSAISVTGGQYRVTSGGTPGSWTSVAGTVRLNDVVEFRLTSANADATTVSSSLNIGGATALFSVQTSAGSAPALQLLGTVQSGYLGYPYSYNAPINLPAGPTILLLDTKTRRRTASTSAERTFCRS